MSETSTGFTFNFDVSPGIGETSTGLDILGNGDTLVAISSDGTDFTPVDPGDYGTLVGTYTSLVVGGPGQALDIFPAQPDQALIDQIQANSDAGATAPLSDTFYYEIGDAAGELVTVDATVALNDFFYTAGGAPYSTAATLGTLSSIAIPGLAVGNYPTTSQIDAGEDGGSDSFSITLSAFDFATQGDGGAFSIDPVSLAAGALAGAVVTELGEDLTISGSGDAISTDLAGLSFISDGTPGTDYIILNVDDGGAQFNYIVGVLEVECFLAGTRILTVDGEVAVERLAAGDEVITPDGPAPVAAIKVTHYAGAAQLASAKVRPIRIAKGALGSDAGGALPRRDLWVSPDHAMLLEGVLVPAHLLLNGSTITQPPRHAPIAYYHVALEPHGILYAEGAATESWLDTGRGATPAFPGAANSWEDACAPLVLTGPKLAAARAVTAAGTARAAA